MSNLADLPAGQGIGPASNQLRITGGVWTVEDDPILLDSDVGTSANELVRLDGSARLPAVDGSQLTNLAAGGGQSGLVQFSKQHLGNGTGSVHYVAPCNATSFGGSITITANWMYLMPLVLPYSITLDSMKFVVGTAGAAGKVARVGIYNYEESTGKATTLVVDAGESAVDSTGLKSKTGLATALAAGKYWVAFTSDGAPQLTPGGGTILPMLGVTVSGTTATAIPGYRYTRTYAALDADLTSVSNAITYALSGSAPMVLLKE